MSLIQATTNIPLIKTFVNNRYLGLTNDNSYQEAYIYGITSVPARQFSCHAMVGDGSNWFGLPLEAFNQHQDPSKIKQTSYYQGYDCFSYHIQAIRFDFLRDQSVQCMKRDNVMGRYLFTIVSSDVLGNAPFPELPEQAKTFTFIETVEGNIIAMPNNYLAWKDKALYNSNDENKFPPYRRVSKVYRSES